jgi:vacuolar-type H+-ATPase subunit E/Vma4
MKSKIAQRIQDETPKEVKDSVREYADRVVKEKERIKEEAEDIVNTHYQNKLAGKVELERMAALREVLKDHEEVLKECRAYLDNSLNDMRENGKSTTSWSVLYTRDLFDKCEAAIEKARNLFK